jgi:hypothetical protein
MVLLVLSSFKDDKPEGKHLFLSGHRFQVLNYQTDMKMVRKTWNDSGREVNNFTVKTESFMELSEGTIMSVMAKEQPRSKQILLVVLILALGFVSL